MGDSALRVTARCRCRPPRCCHLDRRQFAREDRDLTLVWLLLAIGTGWTLLWLLTAAVRWGLGGGNR